MGTETLAKLARRLEVDARANQYQGDIQFGFRRLTAYGAAFWMATVFNPTSLAPASDINKQVFSTGHFFLHEEARLVAALLEQNCKRSASKADLVLDVGANSGFFSLLAAAHGCRAFSFEPTSLLASLLNTSAIANGFERRLTVIQKLVTGDAEGVRFNGWNAVVAGEDLTTNGTPNINLAKKEMAKMEDMSGRTVSIDQLVDEDVLYLKLDVEGHEGSAFRSATRLFQTRKVHYIFFEATFYHHGWRADAYIPIFNMLTSKGYRVFLMDASAGPLTQPLQIETLDDGNFAMDKPTRRMLPHNATSWYIWFTARSRCVKLRSAPTCQFEVFAVHPTALWPLVAPQEAQTNSETKQVGRRARRGRGWQRHKMGSHGGRFVQ